MRAFTLTATILASGIALVSAMPAGPVLEGECCCCDPEQGVIACRSYPQEVYCRCADSTCPTDASTVWIPRPTPEVLPIQTDIGEPIPKPQVLPIQSDIGQPIPRPQVECCCCDINKGAFSCIMQNEDEGCFCPLVVCPADAPTVYPRPIPEPTPAPAPAPAPPVVAREADVECCCCDIRQNAISCQMAPPGDCFCAAVQCPVDAPTVWPYGTPAPTSTPMPTPMPTPPTLTVV